MLKTDKRKILIIAFAAICVFSIIVNTGPVKAEGTTVMALSPSVYTAQQVGETFTINITVSNVQNLWSWKARITWDPSVLSLVSGPSEGPFLKSVGATLFLSTPPQNGSINEVSCTLLSDTGASGNGTLATLVFRINAETYLSPITLDNDVLLAPLTAEGTNPPIDHQVQSATVTLGTQVGIRADAGGDQLVNDDTPVTLNASLTRSSEPEQNLTFTWTFTDREQVKLIGMVVTYTFTKPGVYSVNLTVSDPEGRTSTDSINITVRDVTPPVAVITLEPVSAYQEIEVGQPILFSGTQSYDPKNGTITFYMWTLGDGTPTCCGSNISHTYAHTGTYNVSLTVTDWGGNTNTATVIITVVKANYPLSIFSDTGEILIVVTAMVLIASPFWANRTRHKHQISQGEK